MTSQNTPTHTKASDADTPTDQAAAHREMLQLIGGKWVTAALSAAASLGVPAALEHEGQPVEALATTLGAHPEKLQRLLNALCSLNVLQRSPERHYTLTPLGRTLLPGQLGALAEYAGRSFAWAPWSQLDASIRTNTSAFELHHGRGLYPYLAEHEEDAAYYDAGIDAFTQDEAAALVDALDIHAHQTVLDLGGGQGALLAALLRAAPHLEGTLFDLPEVIERVAQDTVFADVHPRLTFQRGDFTQSIPVRADLVLLKRVLHNWNDAQAHTILRNARAALTDYNARLVVIEAVLLPENFPDLGRLLDLEMMVMCNDGKERTKPELRRLLSNAGFRLEDGGALPGGVRWFLAAPRTDTP